MRTDRHHFLGGVLAAGVVAAAVRAGTAAQEATPGTGDAPSEIVAAASAFLDTLGDTEPEAVLFDWADTAQKQHWSNLPAGLVRACRPDVG